MSAFNIGVRSSLRWVTRKSFLSNARNISTSPWLLLSVSSITKLQVSQPLGSSQETNTPNQKDKNGTSFTPESTQQGKSPSLHPNETGIELEVETIPPADRAFPPESQDFMMERVDPEYLKQMCSSIWFTADPDSPLYGYLETAEVLPKKLPLRGAILGLNRLWINLICQVELGVKEGEQPKYGAARNVTFVIEPSSPYSYLSKHALECLFHSKQPIPKSAKVMIHPAKMLGVEEMHVSPASSHFSGANILGSDFFKRNKLALFVNYRKNHFDILETSAEEGLF